MKAELQTWLEALVPFPGLLACGVRDTDGTTGWRVVDEGWPAAALDNVSRCVHDTFRVMRLHRFPAESLRWVYEGAAVYAVRRESERVLCAIVRPDRSGLTGAPVAGLIRQFKSLPMEWETQAPEGRRAAGADRCVPKQNVVHPGSQHET